MLARFHLAQDADSSGYATALAEIKSGHKRSHWIWYIFPQIAGLGRSSAARGYALRDVDEACEYLSDPVLRARYEEISAAVFDQLEKGIPVNELMGSAIDAQKLTSSLTLFHAAASRLDLQDQDRDLVRLTDHLLQILSQQGYPVCEFTVGTF